MDASELHIGQLARILELREDNLTRRLFEMGCVPGTHIFLEFKSPAGDPLAFNIDGYVLGLRKNEAKLILVEPVKN